MATFRGQARTNNTFTGTATADVFLWAAADLNRLDRASGLGGTDTLKLTTGGALNNTALSGITGIERIALAAAGNSITMLGENFAGVASGRIQVTGGAGDDRVNASGLNSTQTVDITAGAGVDVLTGGFGADVFRFTHLGLAGDTVKGGQGGDLLLLSDGGALASNALLRVSGVETIQFASGGNSAILRNANFTDVAFGRITITGGAGNDTVNAGALGAGNAITVRAGAGLDRLTGGAGDDVFIFRAGDLAGDTVRGGAGFDTLALGTAGALAANALRNMTGIEQINLAAGGNALTLRDGNIAGEGISLVGVGGSNLIDASALTGNNRIVYFDDGGSADVRGGAAPDDIFQIPNGGVFGQGEAFDGGAGDFDAIVFFGSVDFLGNTITNTERLIFNGTSTAAINVSSENAARIREFIADGVGSAAAVFTVQLSAGSTTDLSNLKLVNPDGGDAIKVASFGDGTAVTLSDQIANFGGSSGSDTVLLAAGGHYRDGAVILGGAGNDRIAFDPASTARVAGGADVDTLLVSGAAVVTLATTTAQADGLSLVQGFENVDASASSAAVTLSGRNDLASVLIGGAAGDTITAGTAGAIITGGLGADTLTGGAGDDRFLIRGGEATGDTIDGGTGDDGIEVRATADLSGAAISNIDTLFLAAADATGNFINADVAATVKGSQLAQLSGGVFGNGYFSASVETLVVQLDTRTLNLSGLAFSYWGTNDRVEITGNGSSNTITGTSQNDVIMGELGVDVLSGGGGDDVIGYDIGDTGSLDGGTGNDTVKLAGIYPAGTLIAAKVDLSTGRVSESLDNIGDTQTIVSNFENADFGTSTFATTLIGTTGANVLIGGSARDTLTGGLGADSLTGGGGADQFVWNDKAEGGDTITDFTRGQDKLVFSAAQFAVNGAFDTRFADDGVGPPSSFGGADLVVTYSNMDNAGDAVAYVAGVEPLRNHALFVIGRGVDFHNVLYYVEANRVDQITATFIADLGGDGQPTDFSLSDFVFI